MSVYTDVAVAVLDTVVETTWVLVTVSVVLTVVEWVIVEVVRNVATRIFTCRVIVLKFPL